MFVGVPLQERRASSSQWLEQFRAATSNLPFLALFTGRTRFETGELARLSRLSLVPASLFLGLFVLETQLESGSWVPLTRADPEMAEGGLFLALYIGWLVWLDFLAMLTGRYLRAS